MKKIPLMIALALMLTACGMLGKKDGASNTSNASTSSTSSGSNPSTASDTGGEKVEHPEPTAAQTAALAGGQSVKWDQQGITWTLPANWKKMSAETEQFQYSGGDGAFLIVNISLLDESFPTDASLKATYDGKKTDKKNGKVDELRYLELDGVKGVQFRESPEKPDDFKRMQWLAYRKYAGQTQLVNVMFSTTNKNFAKHQDEFYAILYSTKLVH
jgi:hypothetical protein